MRPHGLWVAACRHWLDADVRQLEVEAPRGDGSDLRERRVLENHDWLIGRLAAVPVEDVPDPALVEAENGRQQPHGAIQILTVLTDDRDAVRMAVLDENMAGSIEDDPARRAKRQRALVVVLRHLLELRMLRDLQHPEADGKNREQRDDHELHDRQARGDSASVFKSHRK
jgi:hypothetical protein